MLGFRTVPLSQKTLESPYRDRPVNVATATGSFTGMSTNSAADARQRVRIAGKLVSFLEAPFGYQSHIPARIGVGGTSHHAGKVGVQPIPVYPRVFVAFQQDGFSLSVGLVERILPEEGMERTQRPLPIFLFLFAQGEVCFAVASHINRLGLVLGTLMPRGYGVAAVGNVLDFVFARLISCGEVWRGCYNDVA